MNLHQQEVARFHNIGWFRSVLTGCMREFLVCDYHPGEVWYNLNEYPALPLRKAGDYDAQLFAEYRSKGVEIVKFHAEWCDWLEICGGDFFRPSDPESFQRLCEMAHAEGLRVHVYFSSGWMEARSSCFKPEWTSVRCQLNESYWRLAMCSPRQPDWRGFLLQNIADMLDRYPIDGLYNDWGYANVFHPMVRDLSVANPSDVMSAFYETPGDQGALEDLLGRLYALVKEKRPQGLMTLHAGANRTPPIRKKYFDHLYIGEGVASLEALCSKTKHYEPYTFLIPDHRLGDLGPRAIYAGALPYLQFPVLYDGYPVTGERATAAKVDYIEEYWQKALKQIADFRAKGAPPTYGWWDNIPGRPETKPAYYHFLGLWKQIASNGTRAFLEIDAEKLWLGYPRDTKVVSSVFVNEKIWLIVANHDEKTVSFACACDAVNAETGTSLRAGEKISLKPSDLAILILQPSLRAYSGTPATPASAEPVSISHHFDQI